MDILKELKEIFANIYGGDVDLNSIQEDTGLFTDLGMTSISMLYMALAIEEKFSLHFANEDFSQFRTVGDIVKYIADKKTA
ncbi:MAG: hypothetical protein E7454_00735 [Ruminococcaceae bacterium]|nr:hypothetical protein [Oscillospiraceae bacterium]